MAAAQHAGQAELRTFTGDDFELERYRDFCASRLGHLGEVVLEWVECPDLDRLLLGTVRQTFRSHEGDRFIAHDRGMLGAWTLDERSAERTVVQVSGQLCTGSLLCMCST
jgi:hypothetical protein